MKKYLFIPLLLAITNFGFCQKDYDPDYYEELYNKLLNDSKIVDVNQYKKMYRKGNQKEIYTLVKFKNDSIDRYWIVGKAQSFWRNGNVMQDRVYNLKGHFISRRDYHPNGNVFVITSTDYSNGFHIKNYKKLSVVYPNNGNKKSYIFGRIVSDKNWKYDPKRKKMKYHGVVKEYQSTLSKNKIRVIESEYNLGKRISVKKYKVPKSSLKQSF